MPHAEKRPTPRLSKKDQDFVEAVRSAEARVQQQEHEVIAAQRKLREERAELNVRLSELRSTAQRLPLFD